MLERLKTLLDTGHVAAVLLGALAAAGVAYGRGVTTLAEHERRIMTLEAAHGAALRELRVDLTARLERIEDRVNALTNRP